MIFDPITINNVTFANRLLRSSVGGRSTYYNGMASDVWKNFEKRFAEGGIGGSYRLRPTSSAAANVSWVVSMRS